MCVCKKQETGFLSAWDAHLLDPLAQRADERQTKYRGVAGTGQKTNGMFLALCAPG